MTIYEIIKNIEYTPSKNAKKELLEAYKDTELLACLLNFTYNPEMTYHIKDIPDPGVFEEGKTLRSALGLLEAIAAGACKGSSARVQVADMRASLTAEEDYLFCCVIDRSLRIGMSARSVNKVCPGLIPKSPYMGAVPFDEKKVRKLFDDGPVESDVKMDGRYVNIIVKSGDVHMTSRTGKNSVVGTDALFTECKSLATCLSGTSDVVLNGELMLEGFDRYEANGILNSLIKIREKEAEGEDVAKSKDKLATKHGVPYEDIVGRVYVTLWDWIPYDHFRNGKTWSVKRKARLETLKNCVGLQALTKVSLVEHKLVNTYEEAIAHFKELIARGEEGIILKGTNGSWEDKKPVHQIKMKLEMTVDLIIKGIKQGKVKGKLAELTGSFICESADGLCTADPGALGAKLSAETWANQEEYVGTVIEVKCCGVSQDSTGSYSLLHPSFVRFRDDTTADTLQQIKDTQDMALGLKKSREV